MIKAFSMLFMLFFLAVSLPVQAEQDIPSEAEAIKKDVEKEKSWWQKRQQRSDIFYPHKPHMDTMKEEGDACMLCHPYSKNTIHDEKALGTLEQINNEALEAICHD